MVLSGVIVTVGVALVVAGCGGEAPSRPAPGGPSASGAPIVSRAAASRLRLTWRLPAAYRTVCDEQAAYASGGARGCPPLIPAGPLRVEFAGPFSKQERFRGGYSADFGSGSLDALGGQRIETNGGHWRYEVAWTPAVRRLIVRRGVEQPANATRRSSCRDVRLGAQRVQACKVVPYEKGGGINGGHIAYVWRHTGTAFVVSVHGYRNEPRVRAMVAAWMAEALP